MISINDALVEILSQDMETKACFLNETLNLSQYAKSIEHKLDKILWKKSKLPSVVVALYRLQENCKINQETLNIIQPYAKPDFFISHISTFTNLVEFTLEKNDKTNKNLLKWIQSQHVSYQSFLSYTIGQSEITVIASVDLYDQLQAKKIFEETLYTTHNLAAVTIRFGLNVLEIPNVTFEIIKLLAVQNINIVEIVSTSRELTIIVYGQDISKLTSTLQSRFL